MKEKILKLEQELSALRKKGDELRAKRNELEAARIGKDRELSAKLVLGSEEEVHALQEETEALRREISMIDERLKIFGGKNGRSGDISRFQELIADTPDHELHTLAQEICQEGEKAFTALRAEVEKIHFERLPELKKAYLEQVSALGEKNRELFDLAITLARAERCLPENERPNVHPGQAPYAQHLEIDGEPVSNAFGRRPYFNP